eukprot:TRINITY_DN2871_c0_g1_i1.p1 TRINITY_DN2871_c0_g1~~TRINITY_DN2871_c0_g1_i1.p1  ORF type:complete len:135 (+),score=6.90 TRINITY_DN2871_c0_g1_i1:32-406(+)
MKGTVTILLKDSPIGNYNIDLMEFAKFDSASSYKLNPVDLPSSYSLCRTISNTLLERNGTSVTGGSLMLKAQVADKPGFDCLTGRGDRTWVVAIMILCGIQVLLLLFFCLVTCKNDQLYSKVWD